MLKKEDKEFFLEVFGSISNELSRSFKERTWSPNHLQRKTELKTVDDIINKCESCIEFIQEHL